MGWFFGPGRGQCSVDCRMRVRVGWVGELRADDGRTVSIEKLCLSLLNLKKVIKVSYLNQESRQCFVFFGFLCVWTFYEHLWQHPSRYQLYGHLPPITKTIQVRRTRHAGHCWRRRNELISDVLLWTPTYGRANARRPARTYIQQLCEDTGCGPEDLPEAMNDREKWREKVMDIRDCDTTWWWWWGIWVCYNLSDWFFDWINTQ